MKLYRRMRFSTLTTGLVATCFTLTSHAFAYPPHMAPVSGYAESFITSTPIANATITIMENGQQIKTDSLGHFGPIMYPIGKPITLTLESSGYKTTQSATIIVPKNGLTGDYNNITFQVPSMESYYLLIALIGAKVDPDSCHVATTITAFHKNLKDDPEGIAGATATMTPTVSLTPFYFDIFQSGPLKDKTNPFTKGLTESTEDGGVLLFNLPARDEPYTLSAVKPGFKFTQVRFLCQKGAFINISPPQGPTAY